VTHPTSVVDYDDEYQQDDIQTNSEDPLTSAMLLLARAITQIFSNPTNNRLRTSSNTRNQAVIQGDQLTRVHLLETPSYFVTHPTSVVDYDDEYQQDDIQTNSEDPLTSAMLLLARAITQIFSNPTNNRLRTSSNTRNQAVIQGDQNSSLGNISTVQCYNCSGKGHNARNCPNLRVRDSKYFMEQMLLAKQDEVG
nr:hypothetical protein [Tanacetum cinerariifolium]